MAKKLGRNYIGIEKDAVYVKGAIERINQIEAMQDCALEYTIKKKVQRIPFGTIIERGMLKPGDVLSDACGKHFATIRADGSVKGENVEGSIHQVGAAAQNAAACNGWEYWYYQDKKNGLICIDNLREQIRLEQSGAK